MKKFSLFVIPLAIILCGICAYLGYYFKIFDTIATTIFAFVALLMVSGFVYGIINAIKSFKK